ncbi:MAG: linear amide C-N hydrolase [Bacillota bacterium]
MVFGKCFAEKILAIAFAGLLIISLYAADAAACSEFLLNKGGGAVVSARTMDFLANAGGNMAVFYPDVENRTDPVVDAEAIGDRGLVWKNKYGFVGQKTFGDDAHVCDGMNTQGLSYALLVMADNATYPPFSATDSRPVLSVGDIGNYLLGTAANVDEALALLDNLQLVDCAYLHETTLFIVAPMHIILHDANGKSALIEFVNKKGYIYRGADVVTNEPEYPKQLEYNKTFDNLKIMDSHTVINGITVATEGYSALPGDYSSSSRFVRLSQLMRMAEPPANNAEALRLAQGLLCSVTYPSGLTGEMNWKTIWISLRDHKNRIYYLQNMYTYDSVTTYGLRALPPDTPMRSFDLKAFDWNKLPKELNCISPDNPKPWYTLIMRY